MNALRMKRPSTALVVAMVALFVALGGTAGAVVTATVPLAKRALVADRAKTADKAKTATTAKTAKVANNAKRLGGGTVEQVVIAAATVGAEAALELSPQGPRPASTAAGLVTIKQAPFTLGAGQANAASITCDAGQKAISGGFSSHGIVVALGSFPSNNGTTWAFFLDNLDTGAPVNGDVYVTCLR